MKLSIRMFFCSPPEPTPVEATGALKIIVQSAHIIRRRGWIRPPNPFVAIHVNGAEVSTDTQVETYDPSWLAQTFFLLVTNPTEEIHLVLYDHRPHTGRHRFLGAATLDLSLLTGKLTNGEMTLDACLSLLRGKGRKGDLLCSLIYYPISTSREEKSNVGIVHLVLARVENLRPAGNNHLSAVAKVRLGLDGPSIYTTRRRTLSDGTATWDATHEFICFDKTTCIIYIDVLSYQESSIFGHVSIFLTDLDEATMGGRGSWPLSGSAAGRLIASAEWKPLSLESRLV